MFALPHSFEWVVHKKKVFWPGVFEQEDVDRLKAEKHDASTRACTWLHMNMNW
jgi:hypothetical protein